MLPSTPSTPLAHLTSQVFWAAFRTALILVSWLLIVVIYRLFLHPLARVPGPRCAAVSNIWHAWHAKHGRMVALGQKLHHIYGPVVRVGPNEVWFNSKDAFDVIYNTTKGYEKSQFYLATSLAKPRLDWFMNLHFPDTLDLLSERDMRRYRLQRRLVGRVYHTANLLKHEKAIDDVLNRVVAAFQALDGAEVDLKEWMHIVAVECLGASVLSWSPGLLSKQTDWQTSTHSYLGWRRKSVLGLFPFAFKLQILWFSLGRLFCFVWGVTYNIPAGFKTFFPDVGKRVNKRVNALQRQKPPRDDRNDLLADLIQLHKDKPEFTDTYLRKMAITNFGAGHETMASTLTAAFAMIALHDDVQHGVKDEIRRISDPVAYSNAMQLELTRAATKEAMRLHPVISMGMPRTVPSSGLHLHGYYFPPGTTVGCNPVSLHLNEDIYGPNGQKFDPQRWISGSESMARAMDKYNLNWGGGARTCPGRNLAELIVAKTIPAIFDRFNVQITDMPPQDDMPSYFLSMMTGVRVRFIPVENNVENPR